MTLAPPERESQNAACLYNHDLVEVVDAGREANFDAIPAEARSKMGQFGTPAPVARLMAAMFAFNEPDIRLLDAGAGVGSLTAAFIEAACGAPKLPNSIHVTAYEVEPRFFECLESTLVQCESCCRNTGIDFSWELVKEDFVESIVSAQTDLFSVSELPKFNYAIQNPPYRKIRTDSDHRKSLRKVGIEVSNIYAGFVALTLRLFESGGQLVAITPRSFCNGPYFRDFRRDFLHRMRLQRIHVFDSRTEAFGGDKVLQENIIVSAVAGDSPKTDVLVTSSSGVPGADELRRNVPYDRVAPPGNSVPFIHLITDGTAELVAEQMGNFTSSLEEVGVKVSTGRVVDFRAKPLLRQEAEHGDFPLIYPAHFSSGGIRWPIPGSKKPNALAEIPGVEMLLVPPGTYVVIKRFSSKEQRRRIEAAIYNSDEVAPDIPVGFENHINYIHQNNQSLESELAVGLAVYLNSSLVDLFFRLFSGHTQVNATDLRAFPFPTRDDLVRLGCEAGTASLEQEQVDALLRRFVNDQTGKGDPVAQKTKVDEARAVLKELGFPTAQSNERSALVLLALLGLKPSIPWSKATSPMRGITEMMDYFAKHFGKQYAPNTRETVRRQTVHQFLDAGVVVRNPDDPSRAVNSKDNVYQIVPEALEALQKVGTAEWPKAKKKYLAKVKTLKEVYAQARKMERIPVKISEDKELSLSPGGQNVLVKKVIDEFLPRFAPGSLLIYVGDTEAKWAHFDKEAFRRLGVRFDTHGKFPDVVVHYPEKDWVLLIEAVTSHGPVDPKRHRELQSLFEGCSAGIVYVTTFLGRKDFSKYLGDIAWETEVWIAESPGHMIHFDGERFLGPYSE